MKIAELLKCDIGADEKENFEKNVIAQNIHRGRILANIVIGFETLLMVIDLISSMLKADDRFAYSFYMTAYFCMIIINIFFLLLTRGVNVDKSKRRLDVIIVVYATLIMFWGSVVTLFDQKLYDQLTTFMVNMITCTVVYLLDNRKILIPYSASTLILVIGLPFFQNSKDIIIGHYVNLTVFIIISYLASRILFFNYCSSYKSRSLLNKTNALLEKEITENKSINLRLEIANKQLKELTLLDDLTGIPNRRCFREFVDRQFSSIRKGASISIIMMDIDYFKRLNDRYGHDEGDRILIAAAKAINSIIGNSDEIAVRWGGDEFIYTAFDKDKNAVEEKVKTLKEKISEIKTAYDDPQFEQGITVSMGISAIHLTDEKDVHMAIELADQALYLAKSKGRNCVKTLSSDNFRRLYS